MKGQNSIDVKYVNSLSIPYLTRFFGSAGQIKKIEKNDNSKYVTVEFAHKSSVDKAFRYEGRVLDQHPIKIKRYKEKSNSETLPQLAEKLPQANENRHNFFESMAEAEIQNASNSFKACLWRNILREFKRYQWEEETDKIILSLFLWSLGTFQMASVKHLQTYGVNLRSSYLRLELERQVIDRINHKLAQGNASVLIKGRPVNMEWRKQETLIWFNVPYPNIQECKQSKIETASQAQRCQQLINSLSPALAELFASLRSSSLCLNPDHFHELLNCVFETTSSKDQNFMGIVQNIGVRDIFYEFLGFEQPNSCLYIEAKDQNPETFSCTLRLRGSGELALGELGWCNFYRAVVWKRWISNTQFFYHIEKKQEIESCSLLQHNICFEQAQFSCSSMCCEYKKYQRLAVPAACCVFYMRRQIQQASTSSFQKLYQDDMMRIDEEVKLKCEKKEEINFHEEVVLNLVLIEVRPQGSSALNQLKLEHYLLEYIEESIVSKGLIVASKEMAFKLASNIIQREKDSRLFDFANPRFEKYIGEQLWRLYNRQSERKTKSILAAYQLGRK